MDLYNFYQKSLKQQVEIVSATGENIAVRMAPKQRVELYYLDGFFAELFYSRSTNKLVQVRLFKDVDFLDPYLVKIKLPGSSE